MARAPATLLMRESARSAARRRLTPRARRVLALMTGREIPVTAHQLYSELRGAGDRIGLTTVYRALHTLTDAGLIHEFRGTGDETLYRACIPGPHDHLVCVGCGRIQEVHLAGLDRSLAAVRDEGFSIAECHIEVHGLCPRCARLEAGPPTPLGAS